MKNYSNKSKYYIIIFLFLLLFSCHTFTTNHHTDNIKIDKVIQIDSTHATWISQDENMSYLTTDVMGKYLLYYKNGQQHDLNQYYYKDGTLENDELIQINLTTKEKKVVKNLTPYISQFFFETNPNFTTNFKNRKILKPLNYDNVQEVDICNMMLNNKNELGIILSNQRFPGNGDRSLLFFNKDFELVQKTKSEHLYCGKTDLVGFDKRADSIFFFLKYRNGDLILAENSFSNNFNFASSSYLAEREYGFQENYYDRGANKVYRMFTHENQDVIILLNDKKMIPISPKDQNIIYSGYILEIFDNHIYYEISGTNIILKYDLINQSTYFIEIDCQFPNCEDRNILPYKGGIIVEINGIFSKIDLE